MTAKFVVLLRAAWVDALAYRAQLFIWVTTGMLPLIMLAVWRTLAGNGTIGGYASNDFVAYFVGALCIRQLTGVWIIWDMEREIRLGELSPHLLRPVHPLWRYLAMALADKPLRLLMIAPIVLIAGLIAPGATPQPDLLRWSLLPLAIGLAFTVYFLNQCCIGVLSFWWTQVLALQDFWFGVYAFCSGYLVPLDLLPAPVTAVLNWLPFRAMLAFPLELLLGRLDQTAIIWGFAHQLGWIVVLGMLLHWLWNNGVRRYSAVGA